METINAQQLERMQQTGEDFVLINVLPEEQFREHHIPGSYNIPLHTPQFVQHVEQLAGSKDRTIIIYCASPSCTASPAAGGKLEQAGFTRVIDFQGGMQEWEQTNHAVKTGPE